jgi:hypothetical protein
MVIEPERSSMPSALTWQIASALMVTMGALIVTPVHLETGGCGAGMNAFLSNLR